MLIENQGFPMVENPISDAYKNISIFAVVGDDTACSWYRIINPLLMLQLYGAKVQFSRGLDFNAIKEHNIIWLSRQTNPIVLDWIHRLGFQNKTVLYDIDDDLDHLVKTNPAYSVFSPGSKSLKGAHDIIKMSAGVVTTTPELTKWYSRLNQNIHTIPNYIDYSLRDWGCDVVWTVENGTPECRINAKPLQKPEKWEGLFTVGYSGSSSHLEDFIMVANDIKKFLELPNTRFVFNAHESFFDFIMETFKFPKDKVEYLPTTDFKNHPPSYRGVDVWLAPIQCNQFNICKSSIKIQEILASGSATIGSCVAPYARFHNEHPDHFILVGNNKYCAKSWGVALRYLYDNPDMLEHLKSKGRYRMASTMSLETNFHKYVTMLDQGYENIKNGKVWNSVETTTPFMSYGVLGRNDKCPILKDKKYKEGYTGAYG